MNLVFLIIFSFALSFLFLRYLVPLLYLNFIDQPNARSSHSLSTPRGGGIVFVLMTVFSSVLFYFFDLELAQESLPFLFLIFFALPLAICGLLDDRIGLSSSARLIVQAFTSLLIVLVSPLAVSCLRLVHLGIFLIIAVIAVINFANFMDGLDGLLAGCMAVTIAALAIASDAPWPLWVLVGSLLGFLLWNWSPAKVFMGDVGSTFLGAVFAGLVLQASSWIEAFGYLLVATPLLADACICVLRRWLAGQRVLQAHRLHLFQRLHQAGWPHSRVSTAYITATAVLSVAMLAGGWPWVFGLAVVELLLGVWLDQRVAVPFALASKS